MTYTGFFRQPIKTSVFARQQFIEVWDDHKCEKCLISSVSMYHIENILSM